MTLNCVVVDDSKTQRLSIINLIKGHNSLTFVADYSSALKCRNGLIKQQVDLIFLDIEMPDLTGFELLDILDNIPQIIFITGKTEYAFEAFNYDATDYLQKPINKERFNTAIEKALEQQKLKLNINETDQGHIIIKSNHKKHKVYFKDIKWVKALGDYVKLVTEENSFVILNTLKALENKLANENFLRIHKSYIINLTKIEKFSSKIVEIGDFKIPISRNKKAQLINALNLLKD